MTTENPNKLPSAQAVARTRPSGPPYNPKLPVTKDNCPNWVKFVEMGAAVITLEYPIEVSGVTTNSIKMRRPRVGDRMQVEQQFKPSQEAEKEIFFFTSLTDLSDSELSLLDMADYVHMQMVFRGFLPSQMSLQ